MDLLGVSRVRFTAQYLIFPNAKRGFFTTLEGSSSLCSTVMLRRFSALSKSNPKFVEFPEVPEFAKFLGVRVDSSGSAVKPGL